MVMNEILPVVDDNDNIIGKSTYEECHEKGLRHRGSTVFIFKDRNCKELLVQVRGRKARNEGGKLEVCGGHSAFGDTYIQTAKRELQEELFHDRKLPELEFEKLFKIKLDNDVPGNHEFNEVFRVFCAGPFYPNPEEVDDAFFVKMDKFLVDVRTNPENYVNCLLFYLKEMKKRGLL